MTYRYYGQTIYRYAGGIAARKYNNNVHVYIIHIYVMCMYTRNLILIIVAIVFYAPI